MSGTLPAWAAVGLLSATPALAAGENTLTGNWDGARDSLAAAGVSLKADVTGYAMGALAGHDRGRPWDGAGRADAFLDFDTGKLGLWDGGGFKTHGEIRFAAPRSNFAGQLWPGNTGAILPLSGNDRFELTSFYYTQRLGKRTVLMVGKINAVDLLAADPFFGGWATQRFMNLAFVAPPSGVVPPVFMGAVLVHAGSPITLTAMVFDPEERTADYFPGDLFKTGVNVSVGATWGGKIAGRSSSIGVTSTVSTKRGQDLGDILLPPGLSSSTRKGSYNIALQVTHMLAESRVRKGQGLGLTVKAAVADGNPNVIQRSLTAGIAGHGMIASRPDDSFGLGGFIYNFSNVLQSTVEPLADFNDEAGLETWYSFAVTPWLKVTADMQIIDPARGDRPTALLGALRTNIAF